MAVTQKNTPRLLDPITPVDIVGVPSTHKHRPFLWSHPCRLYGVLPEFEVLCMAHEVKIVSFATEILPDIGCQQVL